MSYKVFEGANGFYVSLEDEDGFHAQPADNGSRLGFDWAAARRELRRLQAEDERRWEEAEEEHDWSGLIRWATSLE